MTKCSTESLSFALLSFFNRPLTCTVVVCVLKPDVNDSVKDLSGLVRWVLEGSVVLSSVVGALN